MIGIWIPLTRSKFALIDKDKFDLVDKYKWYCTSQGYAENMTVGLLHQFIMFQVVESYIGVIDHKNADKLDCRLANLQIISRQANRTKSSKTNRTTQVYKGVRVRSDGYISARITVDCKPKHLGYFTTIEDAATAYNFAAWEYFGEFAYMNLPKGENQL